MGIDVPPLLSCFPDGRPYLREAEVEASLRELCELPLDDLIARCQIESAKSPGYVRSECIVHFMRQRSRDNRDACYNQFYRLFLKRVAKALPRAERQEGNKLLVDAAISDANDAARARMQVLVTGLDIYDMRPRLAEMGLKYE